MEYKIDLRFSNGFRKYIKNIKSIFANVPVHLVSLSSKFQLHLSRSLQNNERFISYKIRKKAIA